jgi:RHS repeat-associated protein
MLKDERQPESPRRPSPADQRAASGPASSGGGREAKTLVAPPTLSLPKGGGAIQGIGEKFSANPVTGTGSLSVPIATSPGRAGFGPQLVLTYDSGAGNGPFGLGFHLSIPTITRRTDRGLPRYDDDSDIFILSGTEDLVPVAATFPDGGEIVQRYRPRVEGLFSLIERRCTTDGNVYWVVVTPGNVKSVYGRSTHARVFDPEHPRRVFSWLLEETRDDRGNVILYRYKEEDLVNVPRTACFEANRSGDHAPTASRYLERIRYGNTVPFDATPHLDSAIFEVVFDYGEHDLTTPTIDDPQLNSWLCRQDPFSTYRAGFEVRTYRLCRRVLMFHRMAELGHAPCLVCSTDFTYTESHVLTQMVAVTHSGYIRDPQTLTYRKKSYPPVEFGYSIPQIQTRVDVIDQESLVNLPGGVPAPMRQWVDLDGEGLPGVLIHEAGALFYKRNLGAGRLAPARVLPTRPSLTSSDDGLHLLDLDGDGRKEMVFFEQPVAGYHERTEEAGWAPFRAFASQANIDWSDPNLHFIDLSGDGHQDVLIVREHTFIWYPSLAKGGFDKPITFRKPRDEERVPALLFADSAQTLLLADMSGDGLTDLVRVRNGSVCYWPNLGYGRFGARVEMGGALWFDNPEQFDPRRIRLADVDGSGTTDILYLHSEGVRIYANQAGNTLAPPIQLPGFPDVSHLSSIAVIDLLGTGTACLVWSSPLPGQASQPIRYIDLLGSKKPYLLTSYKNNLGLEARLEYTPSTKLYLADALVGQPWVTRLPFPVHALTRVETYDAISRHRFVTTHAYHHGYYDGVEREFRGFGMVERRDTEAFEDYVVGVQRVDGTQELAPELVQPPVTTRTWYHTGALLDQVRILHQYRHEYYRQEQHVPEPVLPPDLSAEELRECARALKGMPLRQEIYSFDGSPEEQHPYIVAEHNFEVRMLHPRDQRRHAVFFPVGRETISIDYERNPSDPRVSHAFGLELDQYGNARKSCSVVYGRRLTDASLPLEVTQDQQRRCITYVETEYTDDIGQSAPTTAYRLRAPFESKSYEITGIAPDTVLFGLDEIKAKIASTDSIDYEVIADGMTPQKRLLSHSRTLFLGNALNPLPLGQWDSLGLIHQSFGLAFTPGVTAAHYAGKISDADFTTAGFVHFGSDDNWWIPSGTAIYPLNPRDHFYLAIGYRDTLGLEVIATFDQYDLLVEKVEVKQAAWNVTTAVHDYRVLGPVLITDPNKNRSAIEHDELGMVVKTVVMGKVGSTDGDTLADPTTRMEYDLFRWMNDRKPNCVHTFAREKHGAANPRWQESFTYSNGSGAVAMVKAQAHPGKALSVNPDGTTSTVDADPRWVGNGRTILNNKGKPVKQYEPYFSTTHDYEDEKVLREIGVTPILYYDAVGRNIRSLSPNGTFARVELNSWRHKVFDANDTVKQSRWYVDRGSPDPATQPEPLHDPERRAAWLAAKHADTPGTVHFDSLGRVVYAVSDYGGGKTAAVRSESDLTGRFSKMFDQEQREVVRNFVGMAGTPIVGGSAEKGLRWTFSNVLGALVKIWDEHGRQFRTEYDALHRPVSTFAQEAGRAEILFNYIVYGDRLANAEQLNLLGKAHQIFDQAGMVRVPKLDFKGNPESVERVLAKDYKNSLDWSALSTQPDYAAIQAIANPALELAEIFSASSQYDALNRPTQVTLPGGTIIVPTYNEANFLSSLRAQIMGQGNLVEFLKGQEYDAKGQRQFADYGNGVSTRYFYDPKTFRLINLLTHKSNADPQTQGLQNLEYTYDPVGNITQARDRAQQTHYFSNAVIEPENLYEYDAIYQLVRSTGRELAALANDTIRTHSDLDFVPQLPHVNDTQAVRAYREEYEYDLLGNIKALKHRFQSQAGTGTGWTRRYRYAFEDTPANRTNRLTATSMPGDLEPGPFSGTYEYDDYGNMIRMPHLASMDWNFMDQLRRVDLGGGGTAYYVYGLDGQRLRKVVERDGDLMLEWIFLGADMIFRRRRRDTGQLRFERWTVHISDNTGHIAQVDTKTWDGDNSDPDNPLNVALIRYQYSNHLGSAVLETDEVGNPISYEEYHPYGTTAYRSAKAGFAISLKRYRFSGKERDDETGLYYFGVRYYAAWLGRWTSVDPLGFVGGLNLFRYCANSPIMFSDPTGAEEIRYRSSDVNLTGVHDPVEASRRLRAQGFDFTGFNAAGVEQAPDASGRGVGLAREVGGNWQVGTWLRRPGEGEGQGSSAGAEAPVEVTATPPPSTPEPSGGSPGGASLEAAGGAVVRNNPPGHTIDVPQSVDDAKLARLREGVRQRTVGRNTGPANPTPARRASSAQRSALADFNTRSPRPSPAHAAGHRIDMQYDLTGRIGEHWRDYIWERGATNTNDGFEGFRRLRSQPQGVPAGAVVRPSEAGQLRHSPRFRGAMRGAGAGLAALGVGLSGYGLYRDIQEGDVPMGVGDTLGIVGGGLELYAAGHAFASGATVGGATVGGVAALPLGIALSGVALGITSGVSGVRAYQRGDTAGAVAGGVGVVAGGLLTAGGGIALASAAGLAMAPAVIAAAPVLIAAGAVLALGVGAFHLGRHFHWW